MIVRKIWLEDEMKKCTLSTNAKKVKINNVHHKTRSTIQPADRMLNNERLKQIDRLKYHGACINKDEDTRMMMMMMMMK